MELDVCNASYGNAPAGTLQEPKAVCPLGVQVQRERDYARLKFSDTVLVLRGVGGGVRWVWVGVGV